MSATIIPFPIGARSEWTEDDRRAFDYLLDRGFTTDRATLFVQEQIARRNTPDTGKERLLRQARDSLKWLTPARS